MDSVMLDDQRLGRKPWKGYAGAGIVVPRSEVPGVMYTREQQASTTRAAMTFPVGVRAVTIIISNAATAKYVYVVTNADNNADATAKLGAATSRIRLPVDATVTLPFSPNAPCTRIDVLSDAGTADVTVMGVADE